MKTLIIEDEPLAAKRLQLLLHQCDSTIRVEAMLDSIEETVNWFNNHTPPDFILLDIHLADGSAFEIFQRIKLSTPVIFTTAFDQYAIEAFKVLSIDYLLKPLTVQALQRAIDKLKMLRSHTAQPVFDYSELTKFIQQNNYINKSRFLGKVGQKFFFVEAKEISFFNADNKIVYLTGIDGTRYLVDYTLEQLESLLDEKFFFRINRGMIVHAAAITMAKPYINNRLKIFIKNGNKSEEAIISRERVSAFRKWADS